LAAKNALRGISRTIYGNRRAKKGISQLYRQNSILSGSLANVFDAVLKNHISAEEKEWIEKIEFLRKQLLGSSTEISVMDYGAGLPTSIRTPEEMYQGRKLKTTVREICRIGSVPRKRAFLLFKLVREFRPSTCLELGTSLGISTAYQAAALELNEHGEIFTCEGDESLASLAKENFERLGLENVRVQVGRFQDILGEVLRQIGHLDFAFIDGHHEEQATLAYFKQLCPSFTANSVLVLDDISWSRGMRNAWDLIVADKRTAISVDLSRAGLCIVTSLPVEKMSIKISVD
jgi:predicted O-methyltransferase YrrM